MGVGMGNLMGGAMSNLNQPQQNTQQTQQQAPQAGATPPPLPQASAYFVAVNGAQQGPFTMDVLKQMIQSNQLTKESHVWKEGMAAWDLAGNVTEVSGLFGATPPPLPPM
jgi:hypothetical protein